MRHTLNNTITSSPPHHLIGSHKAKSILPQTNKAWSSYRNAPFCTRARYQYQTVKTPLNTASEPTAYRCPITYVRTKGMPIDDFCSISPAELRKFRMINSLKGTTIMLEQFPWCLPFTDSEPIIGRYSFLVDI